MIVDHKQIETEALRVLEAHKITEPVVDVRKIAKGEGYEIKEIRMPTGYENVAGFHDSDQKIIYIAANDAPHELGHIFMAHPNYSVLFRIPKNDTQYPQEEQEANSFAAHLLMPRFMVQKYLDKYNLSRSDYKVMASIFGVPMSSMQHTLTFLK
jgi:Zn-dependent peptidase ImmA (M78 family)